MEQIDFIFLTKDEILGEEKIDAIKKYGAKTKVTDYAHLLDCDSNNGYGNYWILPDMNEWHTIIHYINNCGDISRYIWNYYNNGCRPVFTYSKIEDIINNSKNLKILNENLLKIKFGEYIQQVASTYLQKKLEKEYNKNQLEIIGKYTDPYKYERTKECQAINNVYEYKGRKFVRIESRTHDAYIFKTEIILNGVKIKTHQNVWVEVQPIEWIVDTKSKKVISEKILFAGVPYNYGEDYTVSFKNSNIKKFLDNCFAKEIFQFEEKNIEKEPEEKDEITKLLDEINEYLKYADNKEGLINKLNNLLNKYNEDIERFKLNEGITLNSVDEYKIKLILKLDEILTKLKKEYERKHHFEDIKHLLEQCLNILRNENKEEINNELCIDFEKIYQINKFLGGNNSYEQFEILITDEINRIEEYLNSIDIEKLEYQDQESFELYFRKKIHPVLVELPHKVINKDIQNKLDSMKKAKEALKFGEEKITDFYLKEIKKEIQVIKSLDSNISLEEYLHIKKDLNINNSVKELVNILIELYKIEYDLKKAKENKDNIKKLQIRYEFQ